jgi:hypothetical protein
MANAPRLHQRMFSRTIIVATLLALSSCGGTGDDLARNIGLTRDVPDEFTVTTRAPLSMPPDFTIRAPTPGASRPQERSASASAEAALSPQAALASSSTQSSGERALLGAAGPSAPSSIRNEVNKEASIQATDRRLTDRLMFWKAAPEPGIVVDPTRESKRLRENAALGQSVESGDTAIIQRSRKGLLDSIF